MLGHNRHLLVSISGRNSWSEIITWNIHWGILTETAKLLSTEAVLVYIQEQYMRVPDSWHACQLWDEQKDCALQSAWQLREPCRKALLFPACVCCLDSSRSEECRSFSPYTFPYYHSRGPGSTFSEKVLPNRSYGLERWLDGKACLPLLQRTWVGFPQLPVTPTTEDLMSFAGLCGKLKWEWEWALRSPVPCLWVSPLDVRVAV